MLRVYHFSNITFSSVHIIYLKFMPINHSRVKRFQCTTLTENRSTGRYYGMWKQSRCCSTNISTLHYDKTMKIKKSKKKLYTELLEVSDYNASEKRTKVKTINANNISKLNGNDFVTLSKSVEDEAILPSANGFDFASVKTNAVIDDEVIDELGVEEIDEMVSGVNNNQEEFIDEIILEENEVNLNQTSVKTGNNTKEKLSVGKLRETVSKINISQLGLEAAKEKSICTSLVSYIEVCVNCGFLNRAFATLNYYLNNSEVKIKDVKVFDSLFYGFAKIGNIDKILEMWQFMAKHNIKPSILSFVHRIEGIARSTKHDKDHLLNATLRIMFNESITINKLFVDTKWKGDSREVVLEAIRAVRPNFIPALPKPENNYSNCLVNHLNDIKRKSSKGTTGHGLITVDELKILFNEQLKKEMEINVEVKSIDCPKISEVVDNYRNKLRNLESNWEKIIYSAFHRDLVALNSLHRTVRKSCYEFNIYPFLTVLDKREYKDIIMNEIRRLAEDRESYCPSISMLYKEIGNQVKLRVENKSKLDDGLLNKLKGVYYEYAKWYIGPRNDHCINGRQKWNHLTHKYQNGPSLDLEFPLWSYNLLVSIGKFLFNIIIRDIKIDVNVMKKQSGEKHLLPAFYIICTNSNLKTKQGIKPHPVLQRLYRGACLPTLIFNAAEVPMVIPPLPWTSLNSGGYIIAKTNLIRLPQQAILQWERLKDSPKSQMFPCFDSLNQLGTIPWKVNKPILDLVIKIFNDGGNSKLTIPEPPSACFIPDIDTLFTGKDEKYQDYRKRMLIRRRKAEMYSLWCDALYKLSLANHFRDKIFWFPHNMDFRGRAYPCPPHLNHLSSDMSRSLLCFAKGEPLGSSGLNWLKLHLVNLTGTKKSNSVSDRLVYADTILPLIIDSADNPLNGKKWWMESEEPWQTLACCMEIRNAVQCPEGIQNYICHFPVHQDGSCNGLQHYAALGRDAAGAKSVNLSPSEIPQDVYSCIAAIVERERQNDALAGVKIAQILEGFIKRKVIKQTVMTTVYGVTRFGARLQIAKQLKDIDDFPKEFIWQASTYLVNKTFDSLREMFYSAKEIQDWLTLSARLISSLCGQNIEYVTPIGLHVVQPYSRISKLKNSKTLVPSNYNSYMVMDMFEKPNVMKQRNAFPPNFIHSLDSTHMMLTSLHCEQVDITFVSVHDCFWTHPNTVHIMNKICREQFVSLHSQPILSNLSKFLIEKYNIDKRNKNIESRNADLLPNENLHALLKQVPSTGDFNLSNVLESVYFFS